MKRTMDIHGRIRQGYLREQARVVARDGEKERPTQDHLRPKKTGRKGRIGVATVQPTAGMSAVPKKKDSSLAGNLGLEREQHTDL